MSNPPFLTHPSLSTPHGFFGRQGGVSTDPLYASLNVGFGTNDDHDNVRENRDRIRRALGADHLVNVYQIHSDRVITITEPFPPKSPEADAMVTRVPGIALGILTADCVPLLFADTKAGVIGAAHAGWKGALAGIALNTLAAMRDLGARDISVVLGPSIQQPSYEVGPEFPAPFLAQDPANAALFNDKSCFDLPAYLVRQLQDQGVNVSALGIDTYGNPDVYFSYRRKTHAGEADYGRHMSAICLK